MDDDARRSWALEKVSAAFRQMAGAYYSRAHLVESELERYLEEWADYSAKVEAAAPKIT